MQAVQRDGDREIAMLIVTMLSVGKGDVLVEASVCIVSAYACISDHQYCSLKNVVCVH